MLPYPRTDLFRRCRKHCANSFVAHRALLALLLTIALLLLPSTGFLLSSRAAPGGQERRAGQPEPGPPAGDLLNLEEVRTKEPPRPVAPPSLSSTMRARKTPPVPYDGRKVGDPLSRITAPVPLATPTPTVDPDVPDDEELSKTLSEHRARRQHSHHPLNRRTLMRAALPFTMSEDQYIGNFFQWALNRSATSGELAYWRDIFRAGYANSQSALRDVAIELGRTLFESAEYAARNRSDHDYVYDLYKTYLNRDPDEPSWTAWTTYTGTAGRENTRHGFEFSTELYNLMGTITVGGSASSSVSSLVSARMDGENQPGSGLLGRSIDWSTSLLALPGRAGLDLGLALSYSSQVWTHSGPHIYFDEDNGFPSPGFRLGFPTIDWQSFDAQVGKKTYVMVTPGGTRIELRQIGTSGVYDAADGSYLLLVDFGSSLRITTSDGTEMTYLAYNLQWRCTQIKDTNGNYLTINYDSVGRLTSITDTLARVVNFNYDTNNNLLSITQNWNGTTHYWATFQWGNRTVSTSFSNVQVVGTANGASVPVITQVGFADGSSYRFDYNGYLQVSNIRHADTDTVERAYTGFSYGSVTSDCPRLASSSVSATNWTGINGVPSSVTTTYGLDGSAHIMTAPDGTIYKEFYGSGWQKGMVTQTEIWSGGVRQKYTTTTYTQDNTSVNYPINPRVTETTVNDSSNHRRTTIDYMSSTLPTGTVMKLPSDVQEYEANQSTVYRRTHTDYIGSGDYMNRNILGLPELVFLYDGGNNLLSKTKYFYDWSGEYLVNTSATPTQHDANYSTSFAAGRGNVSEVMQFDVTDPNNEAKGHNRRMGYDINGSVVFTRDALNHQSSISYADSFADSVNRNTFAYPTQLTDPDSNNSYNSYNFFFGGQTRTEGPPPAGQSQGAIQTVTYDSIGRVERTTVANNGAYTRYLYGPTYAMSFSTVNNIADEKYTVQMLDGLGRVMATAGYHPGSTGGFKAQIFVFDQMGRVTKTSNPTEIYSSWAPSGDDAAGWLYTQQTYDWKGRPLRTTHPDSTYSEMAYTGCGCAGGEVVTLTDEGTIDPVSGQAKRRQQKMYSDLFGRNLKTEILNWQGGGIYSTTVNTYNVRDQVTQARQYAGAEGSGSYQDTVLTYDGYGRLGTKHLPEQNSGTATTWGYKEDDTVDTVTDARGAVTTYGYNNRHLVTSVSSVLSGSSTINVTNSYDAAGNRTSMTHTVGGVAKDSLNLSYDQLSRITSETRTINALAGQAPNYGNFTISYGYTLSGALQSVTDPFGSPTNFSYDAIGRTSSVTGSWNGANYTYVSSVGYRAWGAVKSVSAGPTTHYNSRMQPTDYGSYEYTYYADGKLAGFKDLNDQIGDPHYVQFHYMSRGYSYDQVGRIAGVGQLPNHSVMPPFTGSYGYDAFGNLTSRGGQYALNTYQSDTSTYTNNRRNGWTYNAQGQVTNSNDTSDSGGSSTRTWTYDAQGALAVTSEVRNGQTTTVAMGYDGDGELMNELFNGTTADYFVRSSVLGSVLTKLKANGGKDITYVPANGLVSPMQMQDQPYSSPPSYMRWVTRDPLGIQESNNGYLSAYDPLGNLVSNVQPPLGGPPPYIPFYGASYGGLSANSFTNANNFSSGCLMNGHPEDCDKVKQCVNDGQCTVDQLDPWTWSPNAPRRHPDPDGYFREKGEYQHGFFNTGPVFGMEPQNSVTDSIHWYDLAKIRADVKAIAARGRCQEFLTKLLEGAGKTGGDAAVHTDIVDLFDAVLLQQGFATQKTVSGRGFSSVRGAVGAPGGAQVLLSNGSNDFKGKLRIQYFAYDALNELTHVAGSNPSSYADGAFSDYHLGRTAYDIANEMGTGVENLKLTLPTADPKNDPSGKWSDFYHRVVKLYCTRQERF